MDWSYISSVFFTLFFVVDPLGLIPVFILYLRGSSDRKRTKIIFKSITIAILVTIFFILGGKYLLRFLGVSSGAFLVAGGFILFIISLEMLFGKESKIKMQGVADSENIEQEDISIFPLFMPMLCGPGNIAAVLMFSSEAQGEPLKIITLTVVSTIVFLITMLIMFLAEKIARVGGASFISIIQRIIGLILSAISVQFLKNGLVIMGVLK